MAQLSNNLVVQNRTLSDLAEGMLEAHRYQKIEHEQIIRLLERQLK